MNNVQCELIKYREDNHLTQEAMAEKLGCKRATLSKWEIGATIPRPNMLKLISEIIGVPIDKLLGKEESLNHVTLSKQKLSDVKLAFYNQAEALSDEQLKQVISYVEFLKSQEIKNNEK